MSENRTPSKVFTILVGVDYSELGELALAEAVAMAQLRGPSHLHVVHAIEYVPSATQSAIAFGVASTDGDVPSDNASQLRRYVEKVLSLPSGSAEGDSEAVVEHLTVHLRHGDHAEAIAQLASDIEADLLIVGTHGHRGIARLLLGSVAEGVVRLAPCPVLVVRPKGTAAETNVPKIEPPCPRCLETRRATEGKEYWCPQHSEHHPRPHTYHFRPFRSAHQSGMLASPKG